MNPSLALAIPVFNGAQTLSRTLSTVTRLAPSPAELLVVDDGSTDGSGDIARRFGARVLRHRQNRGLAMARNTALEQCKSEIIVFIDADTSPEPLLTDYLSRGYDDPAVAGVGGQVLEPLLAGTPLADRWRAHFWRQTQGDQHLGQAPFLIGACCSLRRRYALQSGGFAAAFSSNGEDVDLSVRLRQQGWRLIYEPRATVTHLRQDSVVSLLAMIYRHQRDHTRALFAHQESVYQLWINALRWGPVSMASSLRRHGDPLLGGLSTLCYTSSLSGCLAGWLSR